MAFPFFLVLYRSQMTFLGLNGKIMEKAFLNEGLSQCSVLNKLTLLTYQYETKQEEG